MQNTALLESYYERNVLAKLDQMNHVTDRLDDDPSSTELLSQLQTHAENVADLGMIHGYEGVENIATRIVLAAENFVGPETRVPKPFCTKVRLAISAIEKILKLEEDFEESAVPDQLKDDSQSSEERILDLTKTVCRHFQENAFSQLELPLDSFESEDVITVSVDESPEEPGLFDIHEIDELMHLDEMIED